MGAIGYEVRSGTFVATHAMAAGVVVASSVTCVRTMDGVSHCSVVVPGVIGTPLLVGDPFELDLDGGQGLTRVFTGKIDGVRRTPEGTRITAADTLADLARMDIDGSYQKTTVGGVIRDVLKRAGVEAGVIEEGPELSAYVMHRGPRALRHLQLLAERIGADVYTDVEGAVHCTSPTAERTLVHLAYGKHLLDVALSEVHPTADAVEVWGEGAASRLGADKAHILATKLDAVNASVAFDAAGGVTPGAKGARPLIIRDGAIRSLEAARESAAGRAIALVTRMVRGKVEILGDPAIGPADLVALADVPETPWVLGTAPGELRVRQVRHHLSTERGYATRLGF